MKLSKTILLTLCMVLTGCNAAFTRANHDFANTVGAEWATYEGTPEAETLVAQFVEDKDIRWVEADAFYQAVVPSYNNYIGADDKLSEFDFRIRTRYIADYTDLLYGE